MDKSLQNVIKHDQFVETVGEASEYVSGHRKQVTLYVGIALVVAALGYGIWWYMGTQKAARQAALGEAMGIAQATTSRGFIEACAVVAGKEPMFRSIPLGDLGFDQQDFDLKNLTFPFPHFNFYVSSDKLRRFTGFEPKYSLPQMLRVYYDWWIGRGDLAPKVYAREHAALLRLEHAHGGNRL